LKKIQQKIFKTLDDLSVYSQTSFSQIPPGLKLFLASYFSAKQKHSLVLITESNQQAEKLENHLKDLDTPVSAFPYYETLPYEKESISPNLVQKRIHTLYEILRGRQKVFVVPVKSLLFPVVPANRLENGTRTLSVNETIRRNELQNYLVSSGYRRVPHVEWPGDFSLRGEIIDIYSPAQCFPVRLELFDEDIEKMKFFNPQTQTSFPDPAIDKMTLLPLHDFIFREEDFPPLEKKLSSEYPPDMIENFRKYSLENPTDINIIPFLYPGHSLLDFFKEANHPCTLLWDDPALLAQVEKGFQREIKEMFYSSFNIQKIKAQPGDYAMKLEDFPIEDSHIAFLGMDEKPDSFKLSSHFSSVPYYKGRLELLQNHFKEWEDYEITIGCYYEGQMERISDLFPKIPVILSGSLENGFVDHYGKTVLLMEQEIFGKKFLTSRQRSLFLSSSPIESFSELDREDLVVHIHHGVGRYEGLEKMSVLGKMKDYVKIAYADDENLYVPVEQIFLIHKYQGGSGNNPRLGKIGGKNWEKKKERVRQKMEEMAEELAVLYEKRKQLKGYQYRADDRWQFEFEAGFPFEETPDQLKAIDDVKKDMEAPFPMDRLVCGDVGYGKTEVAMRAAFKAVSAGKQVGILVPTTLLAEQHYQTFLERFDNFPISIKMLSRLVPPKEEKLVLEGLKSGDVDVVVGTHKILGTKIQFKDLGLLIVDEEQRFGVKHKERIKQIKSSIDVLTLSATPIPRTMYMGLSNLRDMSLITTPPVSRIPIKTYVMPFNDHVIKMAIQRELDRGGQVFMIHNRVKTIESFADFIRRLMPEARVAVGHAKLQPSEMEEVFMDFIHREYDILISTTIVENGIDIANANTIVIDRPELLGLSELYQLRGRVGRGNRQGYAYLFYDAARGLTSDVQKRLEVIEEHTELGSGFKIAMKDLEIRGAGNMLGRDQSGFMADVGIEMYSKIIQQAVKKVRGTIREEEIEPMIDISFNGHIPEDYIFEEKERFSIYKIVMRANETEEVESLKRQIQDRYGHLPEAVNNLFLVSRIKVICRKLGIKELKEQSEHFLLTLVHSKNIRTEVLAKWIQKQKVKIVSQNCFSLHKNGAPNTLEMILETLEMLLPEKKQEQPKHTNQN
jgi:transcription-repair coupling factor (superfamily II helicase)